MWAWVGGGCVHVSLSMGVGDQTEIVNVCGRIGRYSEQAWISVCVCVCKRVRACVCECRPVFRNM